jgi:PAS domain S-box-containing protein
MSDRVALAGLVSRVRWVGILLCLGQAFVGRPAPLSATVTLVLVLALVAYNLPAAGSAHLPARLVEPVIAIGVVGDFVAATAWLFLNPGLSAQVGLLAYVTVAIEAGVAYYWVGALGFLAALSGSLGAQYFWQGVGAGSLLPPGVSLLHSGVLAAISLFSAAIASEAHRMHREAAAIAGTLVRERETLRRETSDRRDAEAAFRSSEERVQAVVRNAPVLLFAFDRLGVITLAEGIGLAALGRFPGESVGFSVWELYADQPGALQGMREALHGKTVHAELQEAGHVLSVTYGPLRETDGSVTGAIGVMVDVTDRRAAEDALRDQSELYEALVDAQSDLGDLVLLVEDGRVAYANQAVSDITGYAREELMAMTSLLELVPAEERDALADRIEKLRGAAGTHRFDATIQRSDGGRLALEVAQISVELGGHSRIFTVARDVTDRRRIEEERRALLSRLVTVQEEQRHRIANDIHDDSIQTMFGVGIRLHVLRTMLRDEEHLKVISNLEATVDQAIGRLRHLIFELRPTALDHDGLLPALRLYLDQMHAESGIEFDLQSQLSVEPPGEPRVTLYRLAQEALVNVRKHAQAHRVRVSLGDRDGGIAVRIQDDGRGFHVGRATTAVPGHLGMAAMRERARMAGGWVELDSAVNRGTTVEFWIPLPTLEERHAA